MNGASTAATSVVCRGPPPPSRAANASDVTQWLQISVLSTPATIRHTKSNGGSRSLAKDAAWRLAKRLAPRNGGWSKLSAQVLTERRLHGEARRFLYAAVL